MSNPQQQRPPSSSAASHRSFTPLSVADLQEAQEASHRPRTASNIAVGAAFATATTPQIATAGGGSNTVSPLNVYNFIGSAASAGSRSAGGVGAPSTANYLFSRGGMAGGAPNSAGGFSNYTNFSPPGSAAAGGGGVTSSNYRAPNSPGMPLPQLANIPTPTSALTSPQNVAAAAGAAAGAQPPAPQPPSRSLLMSHGGGGSLPSMASPDGMIVMTRNAVGVSRGADSAVLLGGGVDDNNEYSQLLGGSGSVVPVDDTAWGAEFDGISNGAAANSAMGMMTQLQQQQFMMMHALNNAHSNFSISNFNGDIAEEDSVSIAEPQLRSLPAPYMVPFPGAREVRLDVQTMRVRLLQRGFVDPETVAGMQCREGASSSLSIASNSRANSASTTTAAAAAAATSSSFQVRHANIPTNLPHPQAQQQLQQQQQQQPGSNSSPRYPLQQLHGQQQRPSSEPAHSKFRLCVWKYLPSSSVAVGGPSNTNNKLVVTPGGTTRWVPTPSPVPGNNNNNNQQQHRRGAAPAFTKLHRDVVHMSLAFLSTGELAIASQVCAAWFLLADPWVFLEHYGWVPLGPLSRARRVCLRLSSADEGVVPDVFASLTQSCEHLRLEFVGGVPVCNRLLIPHLKQLKSLELLRPTVHDIAQIATALCAPLSGADDPSHRLHCLCIHRAQVNAPQSNSFVAPLLALRASRLIIRRTVTLLPSALRLLSGSARFPQVVLDRCVVLPTTEAPRFVAARTATAAASAHNGDDDDDEEEPQLLVSGIVDSTAAAASFALAQRRPNSPVCELPCCNFYVDSALRPIRTPVAHMSRRRLYRLLVSRGAVTMTTSDEDLHAGLGSCGLGGGIAGASTSSGWGSSRETSAATAGRGDTPLMATQQQHMPMMNSNNTTAATAEVIPKSLCLQCLIWEKPCVRHS